MSGQTIEVLNTDAEGRLVLADVITYVLRKYKPSLMIDLATLTGAIIVALGDRYAGLFSNSDSLSDKIYKSSINTQELVWRLPMDNKFDKLLDCSVADMKNITGTRGAGSITAAQFIKRFVGCRLGTPRYCRSYLVKKRDRFLKTWRNWFWCEIVR